MKKHGNTIEGIGRELQKKQNVILYGFTSELARVYERIGFCKSVFVCDSELRGCALENGDMIYSLEEVFPLLHHGSYLMVLSKDHVDVKAVKKKLMLEGFLENRDFFMSDVFVEHYLPIWALYAHNKCYVDFIGHPINMKCTLRCKECSASIPYVNLENISVEKYKEEMDLFFSKVDICHTYDCTGGETFLVSDKLVEVLEYLIANYSGRFAKILLVTNATVLPTNRMLEFLKKHNDIIEIRISIYHTVSGWNEKFERFKNLLDEWEISYQEVPVDSWIDFDFRNTNHNMSEEEIIKWFDLCNNYCRTYMDGKIYYCTHGHMANLAFYKDADETDECLDLRDDKITALDIVEYNLGYFEKGYLSVCNHCKGWVEKNREERIPIAEQL